MVCATPIHIASATPAQPLIQEDSMEYSTNGTDLVKGESLKRGTAVPAEMKINAESAMLEQHPIC